MLCWHDCHSKIGHNNYFGMFWEISLKLPLYSFLQKTEIDYHAGDPNFCTDAKINIKIVS